MLIEDFVGVEQSRIWSLVRGFYEQKGHKAWSEGLVPQRTTANARVADCYAAILAGMLRDLRAQGVTERLVVIEVGGGNGRFAWLLMQRLLRFHWQEESGDPQLTYLLTDAAKANIERWSTLPRMQRLKARGLLEFGQLVVSDNPQIIVGEQCLKPGDLRSRPVALITNYLFDSLPIDLYRMRDGQLQRMLMALHSDDPSVAKGKPKGFASISPTYQGLPVERSQTGVHLLDSIVDGYKAREGDFAIPVPRLAFEFVQSFIEREAPLLLLVGDMGFIDPSQFVDKPPFIFNSYFAHYPNLHVLAELFRRHGGGVQSQRHHDPDYCTVAFTLAAGLRSKDSGPATLHNTQSAARERLYEFSPGDFYEISEHVRETIDTASSARLFSWLRLVCYDPGLAKTAIRAFTAILKRGDEAPDLGTLKQTFLECYTMYFPEGDDDNLDYFIAQLFMAYKLDGDALDLLESSLLEFGRSAPRLYVYARALMQHQRLAEAKSALEEALVLKPKFKEAISALREHFDAPRNSAATALPSASKAPKVPARVSAAAR